MAWWKFWRKKEARDIDTSLEDEQEREEKRRRKLRQEEDKRLKREAEKRDYSKEPITYEEIKEYTEHPEKEEYEPRIEHVAEEQHESLVGKTVRPVGEFAQKAKETVWESEHEREAREEAEHDRAKQKAREAAARYGKSAEFELWEAEGAHKIKVGGEGKGAVYEEITRAPRTTGEYKSFTKHLEKTVGVAEQQRESAMREREIRAKRAKAKYSTERSKQIGQTVRRLATLGGPILPSQERKKLYQPSIPPSTYLATGMRQLTTTTGRDSSLSKETSPQFNRRLQELTLPPKPSQMGAMPIGSLVSSPSLSKQTGKMPIQDVFRGEGGGFESALGRLRQASMPKRLNKAEQAAYEEIRTNHDIDTLSHVVSELMELGFTKDEAIKAVHSLERKRLVKKTSELGKEFGGEKVLEVTK